MNDFLTIIRDFHAGKITQQILSGEIHARSTSISFKSIIKCFEKTFPDALFKWHTIYVSLSDLAPTEIHLEREKYTLVEELFDSRDSFYEINQNYFLEHPMSALWIGGSDYAILDGHHRIRRFYDLTKGKEEISLIAVVTRHPELRSNYKAQISNITEIAGRMGN
ncbi:MAG: hypothetical protein M1426_02365 [Patescibacteria group bacterium]|nr:hypothetical protein [Patescibacteria group bacterium]